MNFINQLYKKFLERPKLILIALILIFSFSVYNAKNFQLDASADSLLLENDPDLNYLRSVNERYSSEEFFVITYSPKKKINEENLKELRKFVDEINSIKWVSKSISVLNAPLFESSDLPLIEKIKNIQYIVTPGIEINRALNELKNSPVYKKLIINEDATTFGIVVYIKDNKEYLSALKANKIFLDKQQNSKFSEKDLKEFESQNKILEKLKKEHNKNLEFYNIEIRSHILKYKNIADINLSGIPMIADDLISFVKKDITVFGSGVFIFIIITLWFIFRDIRWVIFPLLSCLLSIAIMVGMLGYLNWKVTVISSNFISIMLILTMEINIHYVERYKQLQAEFPKKKENYLTYLTTTKIFTPILYAVLTTALAFLSLIFCDIKPVIDFGWMMTLGLFISLFVSMILLPYLIIKFKPKAKPIHESKNSKLAEIFSSIALNQRFLVLAFSSIILILSIYGLTRLKVENSFINYFDKKTEIYQGMKLIDEKLGGTTPLEIILKFKDTDSKSNKNDDDFFQGSDSNEYKDSYWFTNFRVNNIVNVHQYLETLPEIGKVLSFYSILQLGEKINDNKKLGPLEMAILYSKLPDDIKKSIVTPYVSIENNEARISLRIIDSNPNLNRKELLIKIQKDLEEKLKLNKDEFKITGILVIFNNLLQSLFDSQIKTLGITFAGIFILLLILFKSLSWSIVAAIPNFTAALFILGSLGLFDIPLDMMTITIASITVGIAIDNSIHYIYRFREEFKINKNYKKTIEICHKSVGKAIVNASITIVFGFSILIFSNFIPSIYFGIFTGLAMLTAMTLVLTLMPQLIAIIKPFKNG
ncbi:MAG: MMPL family transporter [Candidatus Fonsibacter sp.]|nr:MMPL family transporter [Candidatus Fonsibacter sp.]